MPSLNKTKNIGLNYWTGKDKPKKDDFNLDNLLIDRALQDIRESLASEYVATIRHNLNCVPVCALYHTKYAAGVCGAGMGPAGGEDVMEIFARIRIIDSQTIDVFAIPVFSGVPEIIKISDNERYLIFPGSENSLILILR